MRVYLGVDYGTKRVGLAKANSISGISMELSTLENNKNLFLNLKKIIEEHNITEVVVGLPFSLRSGEDTDQTRLTRKFIDKFKENFELTVNTVDERLTSKLAESLPKRKKSSKLTIDSLAACFILQTFLDKNGF